jgi:hypothetical protein
MASRDWTAYAKWWDDNTDQEGELRPLDEPVASLAAHVMALQGRIDRLPGPDDLTAMAAHSTWTTQCACAYDHADAVCMVHAQVTP